MKFNFFLMLIKIWFNRMSKVKKMVYKTIKIKKNFKLLKTFFSFYNLVTETIMILKHFRIVFQIIQRLDTIVN